jgi:uncharacterized repeat protein (TIGR01451 family)
MKLKLLSLALTLCLGLTIILLVLLAGTIPSSARAGASARALPLQKASHPSSLDLTSPTSRITPAADNPNPPTELVRLIFIHHSCGENWLADWDGGLGIALRDNNYFVSDTNYVWGPNSIGDYTDIPDWYRWFTGPQHNTYLAALYAESAQNSSYSRLASNPGGENRIIMFKSCFPNSHIAGNPDDPPASHADNNSSLTVANAKRIYLDLLNYFATRQDKLFVAITAPPLVANDTDSTHADNARAFNDWLVSDWLKDYPYNNVAVFDFYNVLTSNGGSSNTNDLGSTDGNHHRWWNGTVQHIQTVSSNYSAYGSGSWDSHPTAAGNQKATGEFVPLLNIYYHRWQEGSSQKTASARTPHYAQTVTYAIVVQNLTAPLTATVHLTDVVPSGLSYVQDTLTATAGVVTDTAAPTLRWSGILTPTPAVTVTYAVTVSVTESQVITNTASVAAQGYQTISSTATIIANGYPVYLPLVLKENTP